MALTAERVTVGTAAVSLKAPESDGIHGQTVLVTNRAAAAVFLGRGDVTATTGYELSAGASVTMTLEKVEELFAIAATIGNRVDVLRLGV